MADETYTIWHVDQHSGERTGIIARGYRDQDFAITEADRLSDLMYTDVAVYQGETLIVQYGPDIAEQDGK